ncbi:tail protein X [Paraburkholderia hayleyella]|uniref:tail protein X n=1 Tax=Paraburkholderia hayleyella TaxID=2152889 RepID=UPI001291FF51|nr:tail protein X [Paraburkholderia hayleyella]
MILLAQQNDTIDSLCWQYYGRMDGSEGCLEAKAGAPPMMFFCRPASCLSSFWPDPAQIETTTRYYNFRLIKGEPSNG